PISRLAECVAATIEDISASGLSAPMIGHVGDGNFHTMPMVDMSNPKEIAAAEAADRTHGQDAAAGTHRHANQLPVDLMHLTIQIFLHEAPHALIRLLQPPANRRVVIVRARVDNAVHRMIVRQKAVGRVAPGELQHLHAGQIEVITQRFHALGDDAQIFRDDGKLRAQRFRQRLKQVGGWAFDPRAFDGCLFSGGNLPIRFKTAKMINADVIDHLERGPHALDPPAIAAGLHHVPAIQRIAPSAAPSG
ncbi:hypothetical protein HC776_03160, partial [bacterium]|nr:hypothetical protein [bacterium]